MGAEVCTCMYARVRALASTVFESRGIRERASACVCANDARTCFM